MTQRLLYVQSMELAASLKEMKASAMPPKRTEDGSVLVVGSQENGHSSGPLSEVRLFSVLIQGFLGSDKQV